MNKKPKNIEQLYSETFNNFRVEPSSGLWKSISSKLAWKNFFSFTPTTLNAYYVAGLLTLATAGTLLLTSPTPKTSPETKEITINNTIENSVITPVQKESQKPEAGSQKPVLSSEVSTKVDTQQSFSSGTVTTKTKNQKSDSGINDPKLETRNTKLVTPDLKPVTLKLTTPIISRSKNIDISQLATPHPTPNPQNPPSNQHPETSNQSPDPWPNAMDSLFINYNSTVPEYKIEFPNAFTPNTNGPTNGYYTPGLPNNDVFHPEHKGVTEYHLEIYNRRGELIFECNDINVGWDGYINDRLAAQGVYVWKARGKYSNGENFVKLGNIMLIKK